MAADRRVVAKLFVFDSGLAGSNRVEEICFVGRYITVAFGRRKNLSFVRLIVERRGLRMFRLPLRQILLAQPCRPALASNIFPASGLCPAA